MNYWQFKFKKEEDNFQELKELKDGDVFFTEITENHILKEVGTDTIVFWSRTDKEKGIILVTKIQGQPYESDEVSSGKAIPMLVIKKFDKPFSLEKNGFKILHNKLNTLKHKGRVRARMEIDAETGERLTNKILDNKAIPDVNLEKIDEKNIKETLNLFLNNYKQYIEDGKNGYYYNIFMEANIARQEIRHSQYLANLFTKDGNHFHGNLFFKNFIDEIKQYEYLSNCETITEFDIDNYSVITEEYDEKNEDKKGFMDIVIKDSQYMIIIENKTGTTDHKGQLNRYKDYAQKKKEAGEIKDYIVLYLTPGGEQPQDEEAQNDEKIFSISYISDIRQAMINSQAKIQNETLNNIIQQYIDSIVLYIYRWPVNWKYELETIETITRDEATFKNCEIITRLVHYNIIENYGYFSQDELTIAKWIAKYFVKSKAKIERNFLADLLDELDQNLEKDGFYFSSKSNILVNDYPDNINIDINYDINTIYQKRKNRTAGFEKDDIDSIREKSGIDVIYINEISDDEYIRLTILNDIYGINVYFNHAIDNECINYFEGQHVEVLSSNIFHSTNISSLLDKEYTQKLIQESKVKILNGLKQIEI